MKDYYFKPTKQEVSLGDIIPINGFNTQITMDVINANPDNFEEVDKKYELLTATRYYKKDSTAFADIFTKGKIYQLIPGKFFEDFEAFFDNNGRPNGLSGTNHRHFISSTKEAYKMQYKIEEANERFPKGTKFRTAVGQEIHVSDGDAMNWPHITGSIGNKGSGILYYKNWASRYIFTTHDNVEIFEGDEYYFHDQEIISYMKPADIDSGKGEFYKYFSTWESAQKHLNSLKKIVFTTSDGVNIHAGDEYWYTLNNTYRIHHCPKVLSKNHWDAANGKNDIKRFSTKSLAQEYIYNFKNKLTIGEYYKVTDEDFVMIGKAETIGKSKKNISFSGIATSISIGKGYCAYSKSRQCTYTTNVGRTYIKANEEERNWLDYCILIDNYVSYEVYLIDSKVKNLQYYNTFKSKRKDWFSFVTYPI
jgi:hypothetical protein